MIGQTLVAAAAAWYWVKLRASRSATEDEVSRFCRGQIAHHKIPRYMHFVAGFPTTIAGKAPRYMMREAMIKELQLSEQQTT